MIAQRRPSSLIQKKDTLESRPWRGNGPSSCPRFRVTFASIGSAYDDDTAETGRRNLCLVGQSGMALAGRRYACKLANQREICTQHKSVRAHRPLRRPSVEFFLVQIRRSKLDSYSRYSMSGFASGTFARLRETDAVVDKDLLWTTPQGGNIFGKETDWRSVVSKGRGRE